MLNKHLAGRHNQKTHGKSRSRADRTAFYKKYGLDQDAQEGLEHLDGLVWQNTYSFQDVVEEFVNSGVPILRFLIDEDYDPAMVGHSPNDVYIYFGTEANPGYYSLTIDGRANRAHAAITLYEDDTHGKEYIDFMTTEGSDQLDRIEAGLKRTGHFNELRTTTEEVPIMLLADKGYRMDGLQPAQIIEAYNYLERKYNLRMPVGPLPNTKNMLISDLFEMRHPRYPDVPLFDELLLSKEFIDPAVEAYKLL